MARSAGPRSQSRSRKEKDAAAQGPIANRGAASHGPVGDKDKRPRAASAGRKRAGSAIPSRAERAAASKVNHSLNSPVAVLCLLEVQGLGVTLMWCRPWLHPWMQPAFPEHPVVQAKAQAAQSSDFGVEIYVAERPAGEEPAQEVGVGVGVAPCRRGAMQERSQPGSLRS